MTSTQSFTRTFGPTVAGRFYPDDPQRLRAMVQSYLNDADASIAIPGRVVAIIAPHAGYVYSGSTAGVAYAAADRETHTVVILSPSHHGRRGYACTLDADAYRTPLGPVPIATEIVRRLVEGGDLVKVDEALFGPEHAADVHVPFVQLAFPKANLIPIIVPMLPRDRLEALGKLLHDLIGNDPQALIVASSDLSHFYPYDQARSIDETIVAEIIEKDLSSVMDKHDERRGPCGVAPIVVAMAYLGRFGDGGRVTKLRVVNSGDSHPGSKDRVVGYGALALTVPR